MTYPTYQSAKIANPDQEIYTNGVIFATNQSLCTITKGVFKCNPADYCITLGELRRTHVSEVAGDILLGKNSGLIRNILEENIGHYNDSCFVLYAKALEETKQEVNMNSCEVKKPNSGQDVFIAQINTLAGVESKRYYNHQYWCDSGHQNQLLELGILFTEKEDAIEKTKSLLGIKEPTKPTYRYEKVTDSIFDLKEEFERGELFEMVGVEIYRKVKKERYFAESFFHETLYRRIEVTEKELAVDAAIEIICRGSNDGEAAYFRGWFESLFDEGVLVRVNGKG